MPERITILGDGAMATVCSILLTQGGHRVRIWGAIEANIQRLSQNRDNSRFLPGGRVPDSVELTANDAKCFDDSSLVVSAIPTQYLRSAWQRVARYLPRGVAIISVTKGIEICTLLRPTEIISDVLSAASSQFPTAPPSQHPTAVLSGPNIAAELARFRPATAVAASTDQRLAQRVQSVFGTDWFRVYTNSDVVGVELAAAVKNVIALAAGILDGLGTGCNAKAALVTRGLVEITRLGLAMGAQEATFSGLAGLGDLITTCISSEGRNRHVGEEIGRGRKLDQVLSEMSSVAEGVTTTRSVMELARRHKVDMPITAAVHAVLFEGKDVRAALSELMSREAKAE